jgi:hypothetical protein
MNEERTEKWNISVAIFDRYSIAINHDKRDDFNFPIVNFPFICSNISAIPAYGLYISQVIRVTRNPTKNGIESRCSGRVAVAAPLVPLVVLI